MQGKPLNKIKRRYKDFLVQMGGCNKYKSELQNEVYLKKTNNFLFLCSIIE